MQGEFVKTGDIFEIVDMKPFLIAIFWLIPCLCFGQKKTADYDIYSEYFRTFQHQRGGEYNFVVRVKPEYGSAEEAPDLSSLLRDFRDYSKGSQSIDGSYFLKCPQLPDTIKGDTLWFRLIDQLNQSFKRPGTIRNAFAKDIRVFMFSYSQYVEYFENKSIGDAWANFYEDYPGHSILTSISDVACDGKRAVFYFSWRYGGLCGDGSLVMFYKDTSGWRYVCSLILWQS